MVAAAEMRWIGNNQWWVHGTIQADAEQNDGDIGQWRRDVDIGDDTWTSNKMREFRRGCNGTLPWWEINAITLQAVLTCGHYREKLNRVSKKRKL